MRIELPIATLFACAVLFTARALAQDDSPVQGATSPAPEPGAHPPAEVPAQAPPSSVAALHEWAKRSAGEPARDLGGIDLPGSYRDLDYDGYRALRLKKTSRLWHGSPVGFRAEPLHLGGRYNVPVRVSVVGKDGRARPYGFKSEAFDLPAALDPMPDGAGFAGMRFFAPERRYDAFDEFLVFHGASYFRGVGRRHGFGTSARGLSIDTAKATGEEFPVFTRLVVEEPEPGARALVIHALMESRSVTGVFRIEAVPGVETVLEVDATLYPRVDLGGAGIAPLTSMFLFAPRRGRAIDDFRGAVHDADGLGIITGAGERLWRPLSNPERLQVSAFVDESPRGFGLVQRRRVGEEFGDLEARYEERPTVWVEPLDPWGKGEVVLVEIPTETEFNDNIVAFWRPKEPLRKGDVAHFRYRLRFADGAPDDAALGRVTGTGEGRPVGAALDSSERLFAVDFGKWGRPLVGDAADLELDAWASTGTLVETRLVQLPDGGVRAVLRFDPGEEAQAAELSAALRQKGADGERGSTVSERWMARWQR